MSFLYYRCQERKNDEQIDEEVEETVQDENGNLDDLPSPGEVVQMNA